MQNMSLTNKISIIKVSGDLNDRTSAAKLKEQFDKLYRDGALNIMVDLSLTEEINMHGIGKLLYMHKKITMKGGSMEVSKNIKKVVREVFDDLLLSRLFFKK